MPEVIVVGGGPIGSILSILLARNNINVLLLEKQKHPRWKACGEGLSKEGLDIFKKLNFFSPVRNLFSDINGITLNILDKNVGNFKFDSPVAYTMDRTEFDHALFEHAQDIGAEAYELERVKDIEVSNKLTVKTQTDSYSSKIVVGADGVFSIVGKKVFRKWSRSECCLSGVARYKFDSIPQNIAPKTMEYFFIEGGYGWIFPRYENKNLFLNIGVGISPKKNVNIQTLFNQFISMIELIKKIKLRNREINGKIWRHLIPSKGPCRGLQKKNVLLIGDAGGFVNPVTGGGLRYGTLSAIYAADTINKYLNNEINSLELYQDKYKDNIEPTFNRAIKMSENLYFTSPLELLKNIKNNPEMKQKILNSFIGKG